MVTGSLVKSCVTKTLLAARDNVLTNRLLLKMPTLKMLTIRDQINPPLVQLIQHKVVPPPTTMAPAALFTTPCQTNPLVVQLIQRRVVLPPPTTALAAALLTILHQTNPLVVQFIHWQLIQHKVVRPPPTMALGALLRQPPCPSHR
jgi:hypothetical protein